MTPPLYDQECWTHEVTGQTEGTGALVDKKRRDSKRVSKWDRGVASGGSASEEDEELETAYQRVEQTLAEQQFGIDTLIGGHLK